MTIGAGGYGDLYVRQFKDLIEHDFQQEGSVLRGLVTLESVMGERTFFPKIGRASSYEITGRSQDVDVQDQVYERRLVTPKALEAVHRIEKLDLLRYGSSPQPELVRTLAMELGRQHDLAIITAMAGDAGRELDGSVSNASFDSNNTIAVNTNTFGAKDPGGLSLTGDTGLHEGKLQKAKQLLTTNYALGHGDQIFVVAPAIQLAGLTARALSTNCAGFFQRSLPDFNNPMLDRALDGFMGMRFVQYENTGVDGSSDQYVYVFIKRAMKLGVYEDVTFRIDDLPLKKGNPVQIKANMAIGAVRMWEEGVVRILCDPTPLYAVA
jgi:hypothetical protein